MMQLVQKLKPAVDMSRMAGAKMSVLGLSTQWLFYCTRV